MSEDELVSTAKAMIAEGKGLLAADESTPTITKRFAGIGVESTVESRRDYRETLFRTEGLGEFISGVILFDETIRENAPDGTPMVKVLRDQGILPGIKVDKGAKTLAGSPDEKVTEGLDGLRERVAEYYELGARFAKWRAVIAIGDGLPTDYCLETNAHALARYARLCQEGNLVPIVEPEVLLDGDHDIETCERVNTKTMETVFHELMRQGVFLEGMILKPSMVLSGKACPTQAPTQEIAERTVRCFRRSVPAAVPGIMFLSGGQTMVQATERLNAINGLGPHPWKMSFSYARALQEGAMHTWAGSNDNAPAAQQALYTRAKLNSLASLGRYTGEAA